MKKRRYYYFDFPLLYRRKGFGILVYWDCGVWTVRRLDVTEPFIAFWECRSCSHIRKSVHYTTVRTSHLIEHSAQARRRKHVKSNISIWQGSGKQIGQRHHSGINVVENYEDSRCKPQCCDRKVEPLCATGCLKNHKVSSFPAQKARAFLVINIKHFSFENEFNIEIKNKFEPLTIF